MSLPGEQVPRSTLNDLAEIRAQARAQASSKKTEEVPVEEPKKEEETPVEAKTEETPPAKAAEGEEAPVAKVEEAPAEEEEIRIGDQVFKSTAEAIKYAEQLAHDKEISDAHAMGIQEALAASRPAVVSEEPQEDTFDAEFYADPKKTLQKVKESAKAEVKQELKREQAIEEQWRTFEDENPDLVGYRELAKRVLQDNWETIGKMTDVPKARKILATKTRAFFQDYIDRAKPRTELPTKPAQVVSSGSPSGSSGVTPASAKKEEKPLDFVSQLKANKKR